MSNEIVIDQKLLVFISVLFAILSPLLTLIINVSTNSTINENQDNLILQNKEDIKTLEIQIIDKTESRYTKNDAQIDLNLIREDNKNQWNEINLIKRDISQLN